MLINPKEQSLKILFIFIVTLGAILCLQWQTLGWVLFFWAVCTFGQSAIRNSQETRIRQWRLAICCALTLMPLLYFKYFNTDNLSSPLGLSFITFSALSFLIDIFRTPSIAPVSVCGVFLFLSYLPKLVAGPLIRVNEFIHELQNIPKKLERFDPLALIALGLCKKFLLGDIIAANLVDPVFAKYEMFPSIVGLLALYAFSFQIYLDFSGYTDIARGLSKICSINLPENFDKPYFSASLREFWRKWHFSLSSWIRDYIYIPLGGNRGSPAMVFYRVVLTMTLAGVWHGDSWNFVLWGIYHGLLVGLEHLFCSKQTSKIPRIIKIGITFHLVCLGWILFRCSSFSSAIGFFVNLFSSPTSWSTFRMSSDLQLGLALLVLAGLSHGHRDQFLKATTQMPLILRSLAFALLILLIMRVRVPAHAFIYFQF